MNERTALGTGLCNITYYGEAKNGGCSGTVCKMGKGIGKRTDISAWHDMGSLHIRLLIDSMHDFRRLMVDELWCSWACRLGIALLRGDGV